MFTILLHSSKTTRHPELPVDHAKQLPALTNEAAQLAAYMQSLSIAQIQQVMKISATMAEKTHVLLQEWSETAPTLPAIDLFLGDIYSGLQVQSFTEDDRQFANEHLFILSGLYGVLRALDDIQPYRLEMGYRLPEIPNLYNFWGERIAQQLPDNDSIINVSAAEYTKAVLPYLKDTTVISPKFLTISPKTGLPVFVTVHAKVARGAFARWLIQDRVADLTQLKEFSDLGYSYDPALSTETEPVFIAKEFKGIGLSVRLT